jgi:two-component system cell cycle sensor histidine kinase/response regulator CckA
MPQPLTIVLVALAVVFFHNGLSHALSLSHRRRDPLSSLFGLMCLLGGVFALVSLGVYRSVDLQDHMAYSRWQMLLGRVLTAAIPWFIALYANFRPRRFLVVLSAAQLAPAFANVFTHTPVLYQHVSGLVLHETPWGERIASMAGSLSPVAYFIYAAAMATILFVAESARRLWQRGERGRAYLLLGPVAFALVAFVNDTLLDARRIRSIYLEEFVLLSFLVVIGLWLGTRRMRAEGNYRTLFHAVGDGIFVIDARSNRLIDVNQPACALLGATREELLAGDPMRFLSEDAPYTREGAVAYYQKMESGKPQVFERRIHRLDNGASCWLELALRAESIDGRKVILVTARDISKRKVAHEQLRDSEARYRAIVQAYDGLIYICSADHRIEFMNDKLIERVGRNAIGENCHEVLPDLEQPRDAGTNERVLRGETVRWQMQNARDGRTYDVTNILIRHPDGSMSRQVMLRDISEERKAEEERKALDRKVLQMQKLESLGLLAGGIAHDFNNLLTAVLGNTELALLELPAAAPARGPLGEIRTIACHAADLCRQLLAYSGKGGFVREAVAPGHIVEDISRILEVSVSRKVRLDLHLAADAPLVLGDPTQIRQVVMNLITNASESIGDKGGVVSLSVERRTLDRSALREYAGGDDLSEGTCAAIEVADTGCGMDENVRSRIFEPFFSTKFAGRGLGMAAVLGIVRGHKGAIKVESRPGMGTTIAVLLPAAPAGTCLPPVTPATPVYLVPSHKSVLVIDDHARVLAAVCNLIESLGYPALAATSGREALAIFGQRHADIGCVLLDLTMPEMDGLETYRRLRVIEPNVRVIMSSGYSEQSLRDRFGGEAPAVFLQKPYLGEDLRAALEKVTRDPDA